MIEDPLTTATLGQRRAANPLASAWVGASAGSGKTKVLTERILRLMLDGSEPDRILAITYTNVAAAEMTHRLKRVLGNWAVMPELQLMTALDALYGNQPKPDKVATRARQLFTRVVDSAIGVRIYTTHAFCQAVLRRFPIEAGLSPQFELINDRAKAQILEEIATALLSRGGDDRVALSISRLSQSYSSAEGFRKLIDLIIRERQRFENLDEEIAASQLSSLMNIAADATSDKLIANACDETAFARSALTCAAGILRQSDKKTDIAKACEIAAWMEAAPASRQMAFPEYCSAFLTKTGEVLAKPVTKDIAAANPDIVATLDREAARLVKIFQECRKADILQATRDVVAIAEAMLGAYTARKETLDQLDFDDLVQKTLGLLENSESAQWVLYRLDNGIDHLLLDESQDTSPDQWKVVKLLTQDFFAGAGGRDVRRTVFAVGDEKQSIFSFQGAKPEKFREMRDYFETHIRAANHDWETVALEVSFRSTQPVLTLADKVFAPQAMWQGVAEGPPRHICSRAGEGGLVEWWRSEPPLTGEDGNVVEHGSLRLARKLAARIAAWLASGEMLESAGRPVRPGDIVILARQRQPFSSLIVRELKLAKVPVAGIDRMVLMNEQAVMDLVSLAEFLLLPEDDLTLAIVLRSPLINMPEDTLFAIAHGREGSLWQALRDSSDPQAGHAAEWLRARLAEADFAPPFETFARMLVQPCPADGRSARRAFLTRLGAEASDPLDEFLAEARVFESQHPPSLQGFVAWMKVDAAELKRELAKQGREGPGEVTVMTAHGAKGLEAPIVIVADAAARSQARGEPRLFWHYGDEGWLPLWTPGPGADDECCAELRTIERQAAEEEYRRLLYVALTRARDRLYVVGWQSGKSPNTPPDCWHGMVGAALESLEGAVRLPNEGWRLAQAQAQAIPVKVGESILAAPLPEPVPAYFFAPPPPDARPARPLAPSRIAEAEPAALSPLAESSDMRRFERGRLIHRMLQTLPELPLEARASAAARFLATSRLADPQRAEIMNETLRLLEDPRFGSVFGPGSQAEVPVAGLIALEGGPFALSGQIDRLLVTPTEVIIVDFKTNRPPPDHAEQVSVGYRRQLQAYRHAIAAIYPGRPIRTAILWTAVPRFMEVDTG